MKFLVVVASISLVLGGCAGTGHQAGFTVPLPDPNERANRFVADGQFAANRIIVRPVRTAYETVVPAPARTGLINARKNLEEPRIFINNVLQGRFEAAGVTLGRFLFNSALGIGGLIDVATIGGLPRQTGDFGQTLYAWGVDSGQYLVLPVIGPSTPRDAFGRIVDIGLDPVSWAFFLGLGTPTGDYVNGGISIFEIGERGKTLDEVERDSIDFYARLKSLYEQNRAAELQQARPLPPAPIAPPELRK